MKEKKIECPKIIQSAMTVPAMENGMLVISRSSTTLKTMLALTTEEQNRREEEKKVEIFGEFFVLEDSQDAFTIMQRHFVGESVRLMEDCGSRYVKFINNYQE